MSETTDLAAALADNAAAATTPATSDNGSEPDRPAEPRAGGSRRRRADGLEGMVLAELQSLASGLGISGVARMRKGQLIDAIKSRQGTSSPSSQPATARAPSEAPDPRCVGGWPRERGSRRRAEWLRRATATVAPARAR